MTDGTALREIAAEILTEILEKGQYTHHALFQALSKYSTWKNQTARFKTDCGRTVSIKSRLIILHRHIQNKSS